MSYWPIFPGRFPLALVSAAVGLSFLVGCQPTANSAANKSSVPQDAFSEALSEAEHGEAPYLKAARPFLEALAAKDYPRAYECLSSHARARMSQAQFDPEVASRESKTTPATYENVTAEQFAQQLRVVEQELGVPRQVQSVHVESIDPKILAGTGDRMSVMFAIGGMPPEIPANIRRASVRSAIQCQLNDEAVKQIAADLKISEDQVRSGKWPENDKYSPDEQPYFNLKFVLVEEAGQLKVGYFEFMPPSILD